MRKLLYAFFTFVLCLSQTLAFTDLANTSYEDAATYLASEGIIKGYADDTFRPDNPVNRAEFMKIITEAFLETDQIESCDISILNFTDIDFSAWYIPYVCIGFDWGIINGYDDGTFHPERFISFAEGAKMLAKAKFKITSTSTPWYTDYVTSLSNQNSIPTDITAFDQTLTRGEIAEMVYRLHANLTDLPHTTYSRLSGQDQDTSSATTETTSAETENNTIATEMLNSVNEHRAEIGLAPLIYNSLLAKAAQYHADHMITDDFFAHEDPDGFSVSDRVADTDYFSDAQLGWSVGENIAWGQTSVESVMRSWMNSNSHKENILGSDFTEFGMGLACPPDDDTFHKCKWVQVFANKY